MWKEEGEDSNFRLKIMTSNQCTYQKRSTLILPSTTKSGILNLKPYLLFDLSIRPERNNKQLCLAKFS